MLEVSMIERTTISGNEPEHVSSLFPAAANFWRFPFLAFNRPHAFRRVKIKEICTDNLQSHPTVLNYGHGYVLLESRRTWACRNTLTIFTSQQLADKLKQRNRIHSCPNRERLISLAAIYNRFQQLPIHNF